MFTRPYPTMASPAYRSTTSLPTPGGGRLDTTAAHPHPLDARRDGYAERTVITSDGVRLAVRDYGLCRFLVTTRSSCCTVFV